MVNDQQPPDPFMALTLSKYLEFNKIILFFFHLASSESDWRSRNALDCDGNYEVVFSSFFLLFGWLGAWRAFKTISNGENVCKNYEARFWLFTPIRWNIYISQGTNSLSLSLNSHETHEKNTHFYDCTKERNS